ELFQQPHLRLGRIHIAEAVREHSGLRADGFDDGVVRVTCIRDAETGREIDVDVVIRIAHGGAARLRPEDGRGIECSDVAGFDRGEAVGEGTRPRSGYLGVQVWQLVAEQPRAHRRGTRSSVAIAPSAAPARAAPPTRTARSMS